jgi:hypothetical protein
MVNVNDAAVKARPPREPLPVPEMVIERGSAAAQKATSDPRSNSREIMMSASG